MPQFTVVIEARAEEVLRESDGNMLALVELWTVPDPWLPASLVDVQVYDPRLEDEPEDED